MISMKAIKACEITCLLLVLLSKVVRSCPSECLCLSQIQVLCNTGKLKAIPTDFPLGTQEITITNQDIRVIPANTFAKLKSLKKLILDSNNITEIKAFAFKGLSDMEEISVQNNPMTRLSSFAFSGIRNVTNIMLGHNQLRIIEESAFAATEYVEMLLLNNNPIMTVESSAFTGLKNVRFLFLPAGVKHLQRDAFHGLEKVDKVKLAYLDLTELAPYTFRGIKKLRSLTIENSDLATIKTNAFNGMIDVQEIRIVSNKIDRIEDFGFPSKNSVKSLILDGNHILEIPSLAALQDIEVEKVTVVKNFFPCNCRVIYLLESQLGRSRHFLTNNKCISPLPYNGKPMQSMRASGKLRSCDRNAVLEQARREDEVRRKFKQSTAYQHSSNGGNGRNNAKGGDGVGQDTTRTTMDQFSPFSIIIEEKETTSGNRGLDSLQFGISMAASLFFLTLVNI